MGDEQPLRRYAEWVTTRRRWTVTVVFLCVWGSIYVFLVGKGIEDADDSNNVSTTTWSPGETSASPSRPEARQKERA